MMKSYAKNVLYLMPKFPLHQKLWVFKDADNSCRKKLPTSQIFQHLQILKKDSLSFLTVLPSWPIKLEKDFYMPMRV